MSSVTHNGVPTDALLQLLRIENFSLRIITLFYWPGRTDKSTMKLSKVWWGISNGISSSYLGYERLAHIGQHVAAFVDCSRALGRTENSSNRNFISAKLAVDAATGRTSEKTVQCPGKLENIIGLLEYMRLDDQYRVRVFLVATKLTEWWEGWRNALWEMF